jgi:NCAIR mutase (PurE)-related protein
VHDPLQDLSLALGLGGPSETEPTAVRLDLNREARTGVPEVILAAGKDPATIREIVRSGLERGGRVLLSRVRPSMLRAIREGAGTSAIQEYPRAQMAVVKREDYVSRRTGGRVGIITAGTSDVPYAEQAQIMAEEMGCTVSMVCDVGVAGLHRLVAPLRGMLREEVDVIVVVAGMDGALPSVVTGLVDVPVIGLPTSTGYGLGGRGVAALLSMLQTCVPGMTVVNIDNGIGAGASAARTANRLAAARQRQPASSQPRRDGPLSDQLAREEPGS